MDILGIFHVQKDYINYLRIFDKKVTIIKDEGMLRPFVGIVFNINGFNYFAPFSSPEKDLNGDLTESYIKYFDKDNNPTYERIEDLKYGIIRINNMIPVANSQLIRFNIEAIEDENYKNILKDQFIYCNNNKTRIFDKSTKLYKLVSVKKVFHYINLSCNFKLLEQKCLEYEQQKIEEAAQLIASDKIISKS